MTCTTCTSPLEPGAAFCGTCGERVRARRGSLTGMLLDGRFRIEAKLAAGGFGAIYRATDMQGGVAGGSIVALKILHADLARDPHLSARFRREAAALAQLHDPHTVTTYDLGETDDGTLYISMELLEGRSLQAEFRAEGPLPWRRMLRIMRGVCSSLAEAHALGIVHRDLKPANLHLEHRGGEVDFVKVLDFGIAQLIDGSHLDDGSDLTRVGQAIGTLEYMAPEQIVGGETDARSDLYTLGAVASELITGRRPFADATGPTSLVTALMTRTPVPPSSLFHAECFPEAVDRLILRCLARDPQDRFASVQELVAAIDELLAIPEHAPQRPSGRRNTLPGSGPHVAPRGSAPQLFVADEITVIDPMPPAMPPAMPPMDPVAQAWQVPVQLARTPQLAAPPVMPPGLVVRAHGSSVGPRPVRRASRLRFVVWAVALIASGVGLGAAVAALV